MERPDLSGVSAEILAYIEYLENQTPKKKVSTEPISEAETTMQVITVSRFGMAKRTPRHLYGRQNRGGMGVFDLETDESDPPLHIVTADIDGTVMVITSEGRAFRVQVADFSSGNIRSRGESIKSLVKLNEDETIAELVRADAGAYLLLASERGWVRRVQAPYLNSSMIQGMRFHKLSQGGPIVAAGWSSGEGDAFMATRNGVGIRFQERQIPSTGTLGMRVEPSDRIVAITGTSTDGGVFLITDEGKGTIRLMEGFRQNKAPGASGKVVIKTDVLVGAKAIQAGEDVLAVSYTSKVIRFSGEDVPPKTGVVQGVNCMNLRADTVAAFAITEAGEPTV